MNCLRLDAKNKRLRLVKSPIPKVEAEDEIVIRVAFAGLCGTDLHIVENKFQAVDGIVLGHEFVGTVAEVHKENKKFKVGDRVLVNPNIQCGICENCRKEKFNFCKAGGLNYCLGISTDGGFAEYCKVRITVTFQLPDSVRFDQAVLGEPLSCVTHALDVIGHIEVGKKILIVGAGIIGLLWSCVLHFMGHRNVFIVQRTIKRRESFNKLNLGYKALSWEDLDDCMKKHPDFKFDLIIDTSGNVQAMEKAVSLLEVGGKLAIFGVADPDLRISVSPFDLYKKELTIVGTAINTNLSILKSIDLLAAMGDKYVQQ
ncbi:hypothetical protein V9T40_014064 [Parthenolecanium corni]|uniref:Uncharacterized protein n=1 Tax=Parthenolecanium corni TaxID=536013 RepID=A0AAN9TDT7_9HEMI